MGFLDISGPSAVAAVLVGWAPVVAPHVEGPWPGGFAKAAASCGAKPGQWGGNLCLEVPKTSVGPWNCWQSGEVPSYHGYLPAMPMATPRLKEVTHHASPLKCTVKIKGQWFINLRQAGIFFIIVFIFFPAVQISELTVSVYSSDQTTQPGELTSL